MREMFQTLNQHRKEDPKGFYSNILFVVLLFTLSYGMIWLAAIVEGRA